MTDTDRDVSHKDDAQLSDERKGNATSTFRGDGLSELHASAAAVDEAKVWGVEGLPIGSAVLVVKRGPNAGSQFLLGHAVVSVGRHPGSDIFLDDVATSRRHAEFRRENGDFRIVDTGSLNGTYVNRKAVASAVLANGDEIQIGKFRLVFLTAPTAGVDTSGRGRPIGA